MALITAYCEIRTVKVFNSFGTRIGFLNDPLFYDCDPTHWVSVSREVISHFLKNRVSTTKCLFSCLQHKNIKKNILKMKYSPINPLPIGHNILSWKLITAL